MAEAGGQWPLTSSPCQDNLLLDMYLAPHVRTLYTQIRNRALIQVSVGGTQAKVGCCGCTSRLCR